MQFEARFLSIKDVCQWLGVARATIYRQMQTGNFPKPVKFGKASRWEREAVENWITQKKTQTIQ